jgi:signal peptidase II
MRGIYYAAAALLVVLDQVSKYFTRLNLQGKGTLTLIPGVLGLTYVENTGMAFSSFSSFTGVLAVVSFAAAVALAYAIWKDPMKHPFCQWMFTLLLAGAVGNLIDRALLGFVTDMIQLLFVTFAVFNVADICVTVGAIGLIVYVLLFEGREDRG